MYDDVIDKLPALARWTLTRWVSGEDWIAGGPGLDPAEDRPVDGLFVTLRHGEILRGCIGTVQRQDSLDETVRQFSVSAASTDPRFPPVDTDELPSLRISLSLLTPPLPLEDIAEVEIGRDGLILEQGPCRGLFLPEVPVDFSWNLEQYLDELSLKAGLHPDAWREKNSRLYRFESITSAEPPGESLD